MSGLHMAAYDGDPDLASELSGVVSDAVMWCTDRPWLALVGFAVLSGVGVARVGWLRHIDRLLHASAQQVVIVAPPQVDPAGVTAFWAAMAPLLSRRRFRVWRPRPYITWEYRWAGRELTIVLWLPGIIKAAPVLAAIRGAWPGVTVSAADAGPALAQRDGVAVAASAGAALVPVMPSWYPLLTDHETDPLRAVVAAASGLKDSESACVQILTRPASSRQVRQLRRGVAALRTGRSAGGVLDPGRWLGAVLDGFEWLISPSRHPHPGAGPSQQALLAVDPQRDRDARAAVEKLTGPQWETAIRVAVAHHSPPDRPPGATARGRLVTAVEALMGAAGPWTGRNRLRRLRMPHAAQMLQARSLRHGFVLNAVELASLAALPQDMALPGLLRARAKTMPAPVDVPSGGRGTKILGRAEWGGHPVALPVADARQHVHIVGSTGSGKSTLMLNMILDDIGAGRGAVVIDPKGDLVRDVLDRMSAKKAKKVVLIDPDVDTGTTLNPLLGEDHDLVVDNVVSIFSRIFQKHWGPRIDDVLRVSCLTLMRHANATLTLVPPLLNDFTFRRRFTEDLTDPEGLRGFWEWFEATPPAVRTQIIGPVQARLRSVLLRPFVRRTLGTPFNSFDMGEILDGGVLLARVPKGVIGEDTARLMGSFVLASGWQAATARVRLDEADRRDSVTYVDECHNFLNLPGSVGDMLAEARGYHFGLVLAHQNLTQLPRETQLALSANARTKIFFSSSPEDATQLAKHTNPELDEHDLSHLDAFRAAARLLVNNRETAAFTLRTNPAPPVANEATAVRQVITAAAQHRRTAAITRLAGIGDTDRASHDHDA
ncbi:type IV secretion system DNA-binding domain-containing protein [Catellatospora sp. KI3]|uniref:type IV secretion system DNA-binding domain-containing protein n=1 Tax=Catellatospora sp. KI3 TaxID=3041620 RepID=UPI0024831B5C|nr:type IV secretion system DNA-binding domain-containing protein [Catellatospora sp. KI3]MDI1463421.1 type IV secretion system DNA-binding domain-containing protein [Catellatospora sp. KI3]